MSFYLHLRSTLPPKSTQKTHNFLRTPMVTPAIVREYLEKGAAFLVFSYVVEPQFLLF